MRSATALAACLSAALLVSPVQAAEPRTVRVAATAAADLSPWDARIASLLQSGDLRARQVREDTLIPGREHQRLAQFHRGVPVFGGELVRQTDGAATISVFGTLYEGISLDVVPRLSAEDARRVVEKLSGESLGPSRAPQLLVYPRDEGGYLLAYRARVATESDLVLYFLDAASGEVVVSWSDLQRQSAVGTGTGVLSDKKKLSTRSNSGSYVAWDMLRPPAIYTFDLKGNLSKTIDFLNGNLSLGLSDLAADSDNTWSDGAAVDAHAYAGYVYDYFYKRFGRKGLDSADIRMLSIVHPVRRDDIFLYSNAVVGTFYLNAFYAGDGVMVYGEGLPSNLTAGGQKWNYLAGGLDVVAHELTHGVTDYSSQLIYKNESGALNESFSDMMGIAAEFYHTGSPGQPDYLLGEDVITPGGLRSMQNPLAYGDPDHYSVRYTGSQDNGGVHINSGIPNNAFYLAIEGGTHRLSKVAVAGVGASNREQIEKVFYRAFTGLLPPSANFATARAATLQSARDLYGAGGAVERSVSQAWTAVGVE